jgi:SAM-dependent methyltransferase
VSETVVQAAVFDTLVVPTFAHTFGELLLDAVVVSDEARVAHVGCRTGYPDARILERLPNSHVIGRDASAAAIELARAKASAGGYQERVDYSVDGEALPAGAFSHALTLLPSHGALESVLREHERLLAPAGQTLVGVLLRDSFESLFDLMYEFALRNDAEDFAAGIEGFVRGLPTESDLRRFATTLGFGYVEVSKRSRTLAFQKGRDVFESPSVRMFLLSEIERLAGGLAGDVVSYVRQAFETYYGGRAFDVNFRAALLSARK